MPKNRGFSLIELLIVVVIVGIAAALIVSGLLAAKRTNEVVMKLNQMKAGAAPCADTATEGFQVSARTIPIPTGDLCEATASPMEGYKNKDHYRLSYGVLYVKYGAVPDAIEENAWKGH